MTALLTDFTALEKALEERRARVDSALQALWDAGRSPEVAAAAADSLFAPAKRIRPVLALLVSDLFRGEPTAALPAGCSNRRSRWPASSWVAGRSPSRSTPTAARKPIRRPTGRR